MLSDVINRLIARENLSRQEAESAMESIMAGEATAAQIGGFLVAMRMKGETAEELAGFATAMRRHATPVRAPSSGPLVDTCGTGGDGKCTFNISTAAALVAAGAGAKVAKHGNRSVSSRCGSADVLSALGVKIDAPVQVVETCLERAGIGFLFAPALHGAMKRVAGPRKELGIRTIFNVLGPLTNPAGAHRQLLGVFDASTAEKLAHVLMFLGTERALVVTSEDGLDELSTTAPSHIWWVEPSGLRSEVLDAAALGLRPAKLSDLQVRSVDESAQVIRSVLAGARSPHRDVVVLNAAGAILAAGLAGGWPEAVARACESIDSGAARACLEKLIETSSLPA